RSAANFHAGRGGNDHGAGLTHLEAILLVACAPCLELERRLAVAAEAEAAGPAPRLAELPLRFGKALYRVLELLLSRLELGLGLLEILVVGLALFIGLIGHEDAKLLGRLLDFFFLDVTEFPLQLDLHLLGLFGVLFGLGFGLLGVFPGGGPGLLGMFPR